MPHYTPIAPGISIIADNSFGDYDHRIVHGLLKHVQDTFAEWIGAEVYHSKPLIIEYQENNPEIFGYNPEYHIIKLHVKENDFCRWVYQFAHEYCHHLINGRMDGDLSGLKWFEETICDLSAQSHLRVLFRDYSALGLDTRFLPRILGWIHANSGAFQHNVREYIRCNSVLLHTQSYHREIYRNIATSLLPLFEATPRLWKMILHFGVTSQWSSLAELFAHLEQTADDSYIDSLNELKRMIV